MYIYNENDELVKYEPNIKQAELLLFFLDTEKNPHYMLEEPM